MKLNAELNLDAAILVVDDQPLNLMMMREILQAAGYSRIRNAQSGEQALEAVEREKPDLILLDVMLPGIDGFTVCRRLKSGPDTAHLPIIFITSLEDRPARLQGIEAGGDDFISKPVDGHELLARIRSLLRLKRQHDQLLAAREKIMADLRLAQLIQRNLLPAEASPLPGVEFEHLCLPSEQLAGDFYDIIRLDQDNLGFYLLDVSGHGVAAAMITIFVKQAMETLVGWNGSDRPNFPGPREVLHDLNRRLLAEDLAGFHVTIFYALLHLPEMRLRYSAAGFHAFPLYNDGRKTLSLKASGHPLGIVADVVLEESELYLARPSTLLLFSDGLVEGHEKKGHLAGQEKLYRWFNARAAENPPLLELVRAVNPAAAAGSPRDDVALLRLRMLEDS